MTRSKALAASFVLQLVSFAVSGKSAEPFNTPMTTLPREVIGADDLLAISVRDCPELSKSFRVSNNGTLTLPLLDQPLQAAGTTANSLSELIATELSRGDVLVAPIVSVQVAEYRSRFVTVAGAVKHPGRIQLTGQTTVLDALAAAEGTLPEAGPRLILKWTQQSGNTQTQSILLKQLLEKSDSTSNPVLTGGEEIRIPEAEKVYVAGNVKRPGAYPVHDGDSSSILKVLAECEGTLPYSASTAYIYRLSHAGQPRTEIPIELGKLLARKSPDVSLLGTDILYVPDHRGKRMTAQVLDRVIQFSAYSSSQALIFGR
ncbi:MAG: polysaccharide biosynthesis/export family protein [Bryobacteraceae bacterium]